MKKYLLLSCVLLSSLFMQAARIDSGTRATDNVILTGNEDFQKCDVDGNGIVDLADVEEVVKIIMGTSNNPNGDVTGEGKVNAADIVEIVKIMKALGSGMGYFWIGTYIPTYNHFPQKEEIVTTYKSITEALANAPSFNVEKGQYLVILCPSSWNVNINDIGFQDNTSGKIYTMLKHYTGIVNHNEYETTDNNYCRDCKEDTLLCKEVNRLSLLGYAIPLLISYSHSIECVEKHLGDNQSSEH